MENNDNTTLIADPSLTVMTDEPLPQFNPPPHSDPPLDIDELGRSCPEDRKTLLNLSGWQITGILAMVWTVLVPISKFAIGLSWLAAIGGASAVIAVIIIAFFATIAITH